MGREVRMVPADWVHPSHGTYADGKPRFAGLMRGSYAEAAAEWEEGQAQWHRGFRENYGPGEKFVPKGQDDGSTYEEWAGSKPQPDEYMPDWPEAECTHCMMYETTSEGTPISPAFATPEELARWLADNGASAFGRETASYEAWLRVAQGGFAPSAVITNGVMQSGVEALSEARS